MKKLIAIALMSLASIAQADSSIVQKAQQLTQTVLEQERNISDVSYIGFHGGVVVTTSGVWSREFGGAGKPKFENVCAIAKELGLSVRYVVDGYAKTKHKRLIRDVIEMGKTDDLRIQRSSVTQCD